MSHRMESGEGSQQSPAGGEALLRRLFSSLLENAVKYSPAGCVAQFNGRREGRDAILTVKDSGIVESGVLQTSRQAVPPPGPRRFFREDALLSLQP